MRSNRKHTVAELALYIYLYEKGHSYRELCERYGLLISLSTFSQYYLKYLEHGFTGLESLRENISYSQEFKHKVVQEYLQTDYSIKAIA